MEFAVWMAFQAPLPLPKGRLPQNAKRPDLRGLESILAKELGGEFNRIILGFELVIQLREIRKFLKSGLSQLHGGIGGGALTGTKERASRK